MYIRIDYIYLFVIVKQTNLKHFLYLKIGTLVLNNCKKIGNLLLHCNLFDHLKVSIFFDSIKKGRKRSSRHLENLKNVALI